MEYLHFPSCKRLSKQYIIAETRHLYTYLVLTHISCSLLVLYSEQLPDLSPALVFKAAAEQEYEGQEEGPVPYLSEAETPG